MRDSTIARNYAEALLALAGKAKDLDGWGGAISALADAMQRDARFANFLASPQVSAEQKNAVIGKALKGKLPGTFVAFVQKMVANRRQMLLPDVAVEYAALVDAQQGRVHAQVTVARDTSDSERAAIAKLLSDALGKTVVPHIHVNPSIIGGVVVKYGDTVMDGSVRKRLATLRSKLVATR